MSYDLANGTMTDSRREWTTSLVAWAERRYGPLTPIKYRIVKPHGTTTWPKGKVWRGVVKNEL